MTFRINSHTHTHVPPNNQMHYYTIAHSSLTCFCLRAWRFFCKFRKTHSCNCRDPRVRVREGNEKRKKKQSAYSLNIPKYQNSSNVHCAREWNSPLFKKKLLIVWSIIGVRHISPFLSCDLTAFIISFPLHIHFGCFFRSWHRYSGILMPMC